METQLDVVRHCQAVISGDVLLSAVQVVLGGVGGMTPSVVNTGQVGIE